jgi:quercetin dioxygenase-like cupin family protein
MSGALAGTLRGSAWLAAVAGALLSVAGDSAPAAGATPARRAAPEAAVTTLMQRDLPDLAGKEALMLTVQYPPAGASPPHQHDADVLVYVLEGEVIMQVAGQPARTIGPGGTFYEGPTDVHVQSANASATTPAKLLVFMLKDRDRPVSRPAAAR